MSTFVDLLKQYTKVVAPGEHHHARSGWVNFDCPFCSPRSHSYRMGYNVRGNYVNCWACGHRTLADTLIAASGLTYSACLKLLTGLTPTKLKEHAEKQEERGKLVLPAGRGPLQRCHRDYLRGRGFDPKQIVRLWNVEGIGISGNLSWRIFIPAYLGAEVVSWTTRSISDKATLRYSSAPKLHEALPIKSILYGEQYCRAHTIFVTEGPLDAWAIGPSAVATCGLGFTRKQLLRMSKYAVRVIVFDNEPDAQSRANQLCDDLQVFDGDTYNVQLDGKDAASSPKENLDQLRRSFL